MTLTVELSPELETQLYEAAARNGQQPEAFAAVALANTLRGLADSAASRAALANGATSYGESRLTWEEFEAAIDALEDEMPILAPEATTRVAIYGSHD